eukprot:4230476-Pleurochrysis_carterae.AAC.1
MIESARAQNGARDAARSSGQAVARASDFHTGVEHHHTPPRVSGSGVSAGSGFSGQGMADASTPCDILDWLAAPMVLGESDTSCTDPSGHEQWR